MRLGLRASGLVLAVRRSGAAALRVRGRHARRESPAPSNEPSGLAAARRFERFVSFSSELVITCDRAAVIRFVNPSARTLLGYEPHELVGRPWSLIVHELDREAELAVIAADFAGRGAALPVQTRYVTKAGEMRLFSWTGGYDGESDEMFYVARDVTADVAAKEEAERLSRTDPVTGIANRTHFAASLGVELQRWQRAGQPLGLLMIDVDYFKRVNDTYGHVIGDAVLCSIATKLTGLVRGEDLVARWGGEEFALLLPDMPSEDALERLAESLRQAISAGPVFAGDGSPPDCRDRVGRRRLRGPGALDGGLPDRYRRPRAVCRQARRAKPDPAVHTQQRPGCRVRGAGGDPAGAEPRARRQPP